MNRDRLLSIQIQTLPSSMHRKQKEIVFMFAQQPIEDHRYQLPRRSLVELTSWVVEFNVRNVKLTLVFHKVCTVVLVFEFAIISVSQECLGEGCDDIILCFLTGCYTPW